MNTCQTSKDTSALERAARRANSPDLWDVLWKSEGQETWRKQALSQVYSRITRLMPEGATVIDLGGGVGVLGKRLQEERNAKVWIADHSSEALKIAKASGLNTLKLDLEESFLVESIAASPILVATEVVEHLSNEARLRLFQMAAKAGHAFFSVPNDRLGPEEEPQHTIKYTALEFKQALSEHFEHIRVEVLGPYLLAVCGWPKAFSLSVTFPCRDEADDIEATLASLRGIADEIVVGVDPRTVDSTREIARKYAEVVFDLVDPEGPEGDRVPSGGVHFSWIRNQCMDRCTSEWIFMTEAHERLVSGWDVLLNLDQLPKQARIGFVLRTGNDQQWAFPWLCKQDPRIRYIRQTHNTLDYPAGTYVVQLPQVRTLHERTKDRELARHQQRKVQNRVTLLDDWITHGNENSLHYLGAEWREHKPEKAIERLEEFLALPKKNGPMRYHTRLILSKLYSQRNDLKKARDVLMGCVEDDWSRIEHWVRLGDLAYIEGHFEEALQWYLYAGTRVGDPPFTLWWVDLSMYSWIPAQRLAMAYGELGSLDKSLYWATRVLELLPDNAESSAFDEAQANVVLLKEMIENAGQGHSDCARDA